ncbi:hypothetical protein Tco_1550568, partial [Tanacetum coccineum]
YQERHNNELYFNCDNKWVRGHKWSRKFLLLMADEDDDTGSPPSLQLWEIIGSGDVYELVDNGGSHNFVQPKVGEWMRRSEECYALGSERQKKEKGEVLCPSTVDGMDKNMIRLLLKDQADAAEKQAQQHAATFQMQFDALRAELQATRGLLQTRYEGGGDLGSTLPCSMRLDVPKFIRENPKSWIFSITEYFALLNTPADQRLKVVGFNLEDVVA